MTTAKQKLETLVRTSGHPADWKMPEYLDLAECALLMFEALEEYERRSVKLIVREEESPRAQVFVGDVPSISIYAGETLDVGSAARGAIAQIAKKLEGI